MIYLAAPTFDLSGLLVLPRGRLDDPLDLTRRVSRTATLDGGAELTDLGFTHADRTLRISAAHVTPAEAEAAAYLLETYPTLIVATSTGCFLAAPEGMSVRGGTLSLTLLVTEKLT
jgi:hypothetical protein